MRDDRAFFFRIFDYKDTRFRWIAGNPEKALAEP